MLGFFDDSNSQINLKTIYLLILTILLSLIFAESKVCSGQTIAIGHVTAEVIESISAASGTITSFEIETITNQDTLIIKNYFLCIIIKFQYIKVYICKISFDTE